jgi:hypothetical protein
MNKARKIIAYHEAGHAVVARVLGIVVDHVTGFSTSPGALRHSAGWQARNADVSTQQVGIEKDAKVALAGPHAQLRHHPVRHPRITFVDEGRMPDGWQSDLASARNSACQIVLLKHGAISTALSSTTVTLNEPQVAELNRLLGQLWKETEALVSEYWPAIERTAEALLHGRILIQDEIDALIAGRPPNRLLNARLNTPA